MPPKPENLTGLKFTRWSVLENSGQRTKRGEILWRCKCDCGEIRFVVRSALRKGSSTSCGCRQKELIAARVTTHGNSVDRKKSPTYEVWVHMRSRCSNPNLREYRWYGAKGVTVCRRWDSFENFLEDMGERPDGLSIDRIDPCGNYEPSNCRWATMEIQRKNKRPKIRVAA